MKLFDLMPLSTQARAPRASIPNASRPSRRISVAPSLRSPCLFFALCGLAASVTSWAATPLLAADVERIRADLEWIASPERGGRAPGSAGAEATRQYIGKELEEAGCSPIGDSWLQPVTIDGGGDHPEVHLPEGVTWQSVSLANVAGILRADGGQSESARAGSASGNGAGSGESASDRPANGPVSEGDPYTVIVGAHFDHLGQSSEGIYAGADDNASGVSVLLETARLLAQSGPFRNDILFIAFDGEEAQTLGSSYYVQHPLVPLERTIAMINLDTIGRMQDRRLYAMASGTAAEFGDILRGVNLGFGFDLATPEAGSFASDHLPFLEHGIAALHLSTGANPDYHRITDTAEKITWNELAETVDFVVELVSFLANESDPLTFVPPGATKLATAAPSGPPRRVSLGTIPDFARESGGVLLAGVMPGSPAEEAGLTKGDIVVVLAGTPIDNLADFSAVLKEHQPGDEVTVEVLRDGAKVEYKVTLVERSH